MTTVDLELVSDLRQLPAQEAATYAEWFACLAEPTRVRLLHAVATSPRGISVGELTDLLGTSQSTCSHHVRKLAEVGFLHLHKQGTTTVVTINEACCAGLPHAADAVMGALTPRPCCPSDLPADVTVRALELGDWPEVRRIYSETATLGAATLDNTTPSRATLDRQWLPGHRWVAELDGHLVGWAAAAPASSRHADTGIADTFLAVDPARHGRGIGKTLLHKQVTEADCAGLTTLQTSAYTTDRARIALHHTGGYRTVGIRERITQHNNTWHDTVLLERRAA